MHADGDNGPQPDPAFAVTTVIGGRNVLVQVIRHAEQRMRARRITIDEVLACLRHPDDRNLPADPPRLCYGRWDDGGRKQLKVVFEREDWDTDDRKVIVISVFRGS